MLAGIRIVNQNISDKEKMRNVLKQILENFLNIKNFSDLKKTSSDLVYLMDDQIEALCTKDYYDAKMNS